MMKWQKRGLIFCPHGEYEWMESHASVPTVDVISADRLRIYFASRDRKNRSHISFVEVEAENPSNVLYVHDKPVIRPGKPGMFDDMGAMPSHVLNVGKEKWLYYLGWNIRNSIAYHNSIGLAISRDGGITFEKYSEGPLFDRNYIEPYYSAVPYILIENSLWRMWYLSNTKWVEHDGKMEPFYHIKYAESDNGIDWRRDGRVAIDFKDEKEAGIVRACVLKDKDVYRMWYSHRNLVDYRDDPENSYRIGYAESEDGLDWVRKDEEAGIDVSPSGWDSQMIEYPFVLEHQGRLRMFYNGNTFGKSGFGYAESSL